MVQGPYNLSTGFTHGSSRSNELIMMIVTSQVRRASKIESKGFLWRKFNLEILKEYCSYKKLKLLGRKFDHVESFKGQEFILILITENKEELDFL